MAKKSKISSGIKRYKITGLKYQSINTTFNGKMFYTPKKGESITKECLELPENIKRLVDNGIIAIQELS